MNRHISSLIRDGVTDIVAVMCSGGNSTCICQGKYFLPCVALSKRSALWSDRRPHAAIMEKQSRTCSAMETNVLTTRRMKLEECGTGNVIIFPLYLLPYDWHINLCAPFAIVIVFFYDVF